MATAIIDGITTRYEVQGSGPPLLMYAPGGFNAIVETWSTQGVYAKIRLLDHLPKKYTCILFDRRECGQSGGRVERVAWAHYVAQGKGLLDHLNIARAHIMGGCMGCCPVTAFAVAYPQATLSIVLYWPVGGAKYRISSHQRFAEHLAFVQQHGLDAVVALVTKDGKTFGADPRGGPWAAVIKADPAFAAAYARQNIDAYKLIVVGMARTHVRPRHRARCRARGSPAARHSRARHSRPGRRARDLGRALPGRMPASGRILGRPRRRADRNNSPGAGAGVSRKG